MCIRGKGRGRAGDDNSSFLALPEEILKKVFDSLPTPADRNVVSLVCKRLYHLEGNSRSAVFVSNCYAIEPSTLVTRFPNALSITIKGKPRIVDFSLLPHAEIWGAYATPWVEVITKYYKSITHLKLKRVSISDDEIERLVSACGDSLHTLELVKCSGFSATGLNSIARACRNLITLNLSEAEIQNSGDLLWLTTLADTAKLLQVLDLSLTGVEDVNQAVLEKLASRCNTLRLCESMKTDHVLPVLEAGTKNICHLGIGLYSQIGVCGEDPYMIAEALGKCTMLKDISAFWEHEACVMMLIPIAARLTRLDLTYALLAEFQIVDLVGACVNLEILQCTDVIGDRGLQEVGTMCSKMRRLVVQQHEEGFATQHGLIGLAKGCHLLEKIVIYAADMTNEALETLAINCPNLTDIRICLIQKYHESHPVIELEGNVTLNDGVKAILIKCSKARRLALCFSRFGLSNMVLNDEGLDHIGKYGGNLQIITLSNCGGSDAGFASIAVGCVKLRKMEIRHCPFGDGSMAALAVGCPCLKYVWVQACQVELPGVRMLAQRSGFFVEVVKESNGDEGLIPWQFIAYASTAPQRTDHPHNIDFVHDNYTTPLYNEQFLIHNILADEEDLPVEAPQ